MPKPIKFFVRNGDAARTIILLHGFSGNSHDTFGMMPAFLTGNRDLTSYDLHCFGYPTSLRPDITGVWAADPNLTELSSYFAQHLETEFAKYKEIILIAHSMGGLIVQRALINSSALGRVRHVILFGTPSGGLKKAGLGKLFKQQVRDMGSDSKFITGLRKDWEATFADPPFELTVVAGLSDQFVPPDSCLRPFREGHHRRVEGNHLEMVKPATADADSVRLIASLLLGKSESKPSGIADSSVSNCGKGDTKLIATRAIALELAGRTQDAIDLLEQNKDLGNYLIGTLAGRYKRRWLATSDVGTGRLALGNYERGFQKSSLDRKPKPTAYHAINMAFMLLALDGDRVRAKEKAEEAIKNIDQEPSSEWYHATRGEAQIHLGEGASAIQSYKQAQQTLDPRERASMFQQAIWTARLLEDEFLENQLAAIMLLGE